MAEAATNEQLRLQRELSKHRWIRLREIGWALIGSWQLLSLLSEFVYVVDLQARPVRILGKVLGLVGLVLVAYGFERLMRVEHHHAMYLGRLRRRVRAFARRNG